jgi:hypothetical protein
MGTFGVCSGATMTAGRDRQPGGAESRVPASEAFHCRGKTQRTILLRRNGHNV